MIYAICWHSTKELLDSKSFQKHWPNYGGNGLHGWHPPKKVYITLGAAKNGLRWIPDEIRSMVGIYTLEATSCIMFGDAPK